MRAYPEGEARAQVVVHDGDDDVDRRDARVHWAARRPHPGPAITCGATSHHATTVWNMEDDVLGMMWTARGGGPTRGLHSSTFWLNASAFCGIRWVHYFPPVY